MSYVLCLLSGILTVLPLIFPKLYLLSWVSLLPMLLTVTKHGKPYLHGLLYGMGFYLPLYYWFIKLYPLDFAGFTPVEAVGVIAFCWVGLSLLQAAELAFVPFVYHYLGKSETNPWLLPPVAAACYAVFEWAQTLGWTGVPWGRLALSQTGFLPNIQSASLLGSCFVSFLIVLVNGLFSIIIENGFLPQKKKRIAAALAAGVLLVNGIYGVIRIRAVESKEREEVPVALIQGNIASGDKWADDSLTASLALYTELTKDAVAESGARIVVWPESVITTSVPQSARIRETLGELAKETDAYLLVGCFDYVKDTSTGDTAFYNAITLFRPDGTMDETVYHKRHLVPFGEYLPMSGFFHTFLPAIAEMNLFSSDLTPGDGPALFETEFGKIGGLVCFDSIYDILSRDSVNAGAELLSLSTNDSWYLDSASVWQHNAHAALRAVENGRSVIRAANTGVSSLITPTGRTTDRLEPLVRGYVTGTTCFSAEKTLYSHTGNLLILLCCSFLLFDAGRLIVKRVRNGNTGSETEH